MSNPIVAIVGRPNVGKSAFFNYIVGKRISIVEDTPGVTRDRIYAKSEWRGREFTVIDTGGIEPFSNDLILKQMRAQAEIAIETADVIILITDIKDGVTAADIEVAQMLYKSGKPSIVAVNKVDNVGVMPAEAYEFYNLGLGEIFTISSLHGLGIGELLDAIYSKFDDGTNQEEDDDVIHVAIIGKPNAGKSSLLNKFLGEERAIVSDKPGTTRDALDTPIEHDGQKYIFIDTAGIRRKSKIYDNVEKYSILRSWTAVERADVCLLLIDAADGVTEQDTRIAGYAHEEGKGIIVAVNKWDLIEKENSTFKQYTDETKAKLPFMRYAPVTTISAKTGQRVTGLYKMIEEVYSSCNLRVATGVLNDILNDAMAMVQPPSDKGKRLKIFYMTQTSVKPPTFVLFVNSKDLLHFSYLRYIENQLREAFGFYGTPVRFIVREKNKGEK
ncbi:MAG: ribosome biogenesis GTPase Der [Clostridia bacterium]|nr:ribosome biogenesis GTPase Der [Clostridia bacterium]MBN2882678.1 ribosome biogenesis GTPase Der [Clostridia bacterium]